MKLFYIIFLLSVFGNVDAQKSKSKAIDTSNYYDYYQNKGSTNWLRISDATPIIIDELKKAGLSYAFINVGSLLKVNDTTHLVVTVSFTQDPEFGFIYEQSHSAFPNKTERMFLRDSDPQTFQQYERDLKGKLIFNESTQLPNNIFLLRETCYWYQYGDPDRDFAVSKTIAENILRQDIRNYLRPVK